MSEHLIEKKHSIRREGETQARFMDSTSDARNVSDAYALPGRDAHQTIAGAQAQTATPPLVTQTIPAGAQQGGLIGFGIVLSQIVQKKQRWSRSCWG